MAIKSYTKLYYKDLRGFAFKERKNNVKEQLLCYQLYESDPRS